MIIGSGDIASVLVDKKDKLFFATGVSNSQETDEMAYQLEKDLANLLVKTQKMQEVQFVYFSSLAVFEKETRYLKHKREMEEFVKTLPNYCIVRLGNITWGNNPHTIINSLRTKHKNGQRFPIKDEYRYIVKEEEFLYWISLIPSWSCEISITGQRMKVQELVDKYVL